jgi:hypothetical protein
MFPRISIVLSLALVWSPDLARAQSDPTTDAVNQISAAIFRSAPHLIETRGEGGRKGIELRMGDVTITSLPRANGNRFVEVRLPAAEQNGKREFPQLVITAERQAYPHGGPEIMVQIPAGRKGDYPLNFIINRGITYHQLGLGTIPARDAETLLGEAGFTPSAKLPAEARRLITELGGIRGIPALDKAVGFLKRTPATATPTRPLRTAPRR